MAQIIQEQGTPTVRPSIQSDWEVRRTGLSRYFAELVGTYCLVFAGTGAVVVNRVSGGSLTSLGVGLVFGLVLMAMTYAIGSVSGAHLNPAVTIGFWASGRHAGVEVIPYMVAQLIGAVLASLTLRAAFAGQATSLGLTLPSGAAGQSFLVELVLSFILVLTAIEATSRHATRPFGGLAVSAALGIGVTVGLMISGGSLNPARSFGPALVSGSFASHWIYWAAPILGGLIAAGFSRAFYKPSMQAPVH